MTEATIRELARQSGLDDAHTGNVFVLKREVSAMQKADDLSAVVVADLAGKFSEIEQCHGSEVVESRTA